MPSLDCSDGSLEGASANLRRLVQRVWELSPDSPVVVTTGRLPEGYRSVEEYVVVPRASSARWLLPSGAHPATVASLWRYVGMKRIPLRVTRAALTAAFVTRQGYRVFPDRLRVGIDERVPPGEEAGWLLRRHLEVVLGRASLFPAIEVRRANPNAKPTLQLFDGAGEAVGYARVGWSPGTRRLVSAESDALSAVQYAVPGLITPRLMATGEWRDRLLSVASPLPEPLRRWSGRPEDSPALLLGIAERGNGARQRLRSSPYEQRLRGELVAAGEHEPEAAAVLLAWLDALGDREEELAFGRWHGDWVPWNHGSHRGTVVAWDWEHSADTAPVGFDLLHWHFQQRIPEAGIDASVTAVQDARADLAVLGVPPDHRSLVAALYLLEMFARVTRMAVGGGGWNPRFHPRMLGIAHDWTVHRRDR
jgi:hypothetical protein